MNALGLLLAFLTGVVSTIALELLGLQHLLEPLREPISFFLGLRS